MIQYNVKEKRHKNHEMDGKYGVIIHNGMFNGYPITIVNNQNDDNVEALIHLSEDVRLPTTVGIYTDFLYAGFYSDEDFAKFTYKMFDYTKTTLSQSAIIHSLQKVLYHLQPSLQGHSLVGTTLKGIENDPNYYTGYYVLNDEETYTILKCRDEYKFFYGHKRYYPDWKNEEDLIYHGSIDFDVYADALNLFSLRRRIVMETNELLDTGGMKLIKEYMEQKDKFGMKLQAFLL